MEASVPTTDHLDLAVAAAGPDPDDLPQVFGMPLNRLLTIWRGPINIIAATLSSWLLVHVHMLGLFHVQHDGLSTAIAQGIVWIVTAVLTDRGIAQWVKGHHLHIAGQAEVTSALVRSVPTALATNHPDGDFYDPADFEDPLTAEEVVEADTEFIEDPASEVEGALPTDDEEAAKFPEGV